MSNESEKSYLESQIATLTQEKARMPARLDRLNAQQESRIEALLAEVGVLSRVREIRDGTEELRRNLRSQSDTLNGKIEALQAVLDKYHATPAKPVPPRVVAPPRVLAPPQHVVALPAHDPVNSGSEVYEDGEDEEDGWDESLVEDGGRDEIADAIENATDEAAVRVLLARYTRRA